MSKEFAVPLIYRSQAIRALKKSRSEIDPRKKDISPTVIDLGPLRLYFARHFGFCYGVENAIEIAYRAATENEGRRVFLLSEIIHNPEVNKDLQELGVRFLMRPDGTPVFPLDSLTSADVVIIPAFGTTVEILTTLKERNVETLRYDTTCPFVQKVWKRAAELGKKRFSVIVHGKRTHEETRATFSHSKESAPTLVVRDIEDTRSLIAYMEGVLAEEKFWDLFGSAVSANFNPQTDLARIGVVNQTTMLATETQAIATALRDAMVRMYGGANIEEHFADTRDTLCYATYENQSATVALVNSGVEIALVAGGYNSSNTSHLVELGASVIPTYFIKNESEILSVDRIRHFDLHSHTVVESNSWLPKKEPASIAITAGASCPDAIIEGIADRVISFYPGALKLGQAKQSVET